MGSEADFLKQSRHVPTDVRLQRSARMEVFKKKTIYCVNNYVKNYGPLILTFVQLFKCYSYSYSQSNLYNFCRWENFYKNEQQVLKLTHNIQRI